MARTLKFNSLRLFGALIALLLLSAKPAVGQNLIVNGDFESYSIYGAIAAPSATDYQRVNGNYVVEAGHYVINTTTHGHGGGQGWPEPANSNGKFMIVNGYGGDTNPTKVVWRQTVAVTTQTNFTVSYRYVNLNRIIYGQINPSKLQVKINGVNFGSVNTLPTDNNWHDWNNNGTKWNSGTATQAIIEIYDTYTGNQGLGDDFCLDNISLVPDVVYSVDAIDDSGISVCLNVYQDIDVLANDMVQPNANDATVTVVTAPAHGTAVVQNNRKIRYTFTGGNYTTDQFKYRVTTHGAYDEAWVYVSTSQPPTVANITAPDAICAGSPLGIATPSVNPNVTGHWEYCQTQNGSNWVQFDPSSIPSSMNNYYVRYSASNDCGEGHSNAVQIHVGDEPTVGTPATPPAICAGGSFTLTTPTIQNNGSAIIGQGWQIAQSQNGTYNAFNNQNVPYSYNGYWIRYYAENDCGLTYSASVQITVNDTPIVGSITAPAAICAGESFSLTTPTVTWRHVNQGTGSWEIQINGTWQPLTNNNIPYSYNGCSLRYRAVNGCGEAFSSNTVQVTVYSTDPIDEGDMTACDAIYHHGVYCNHTGTYVTDSITPNGCTIQVSWHFTLGEAYIAPVQYQEACNSYYWPKTQQTYFESNVYETIVYSSDPQVCDSTFILDLTINHAPTIDNNLSTPSDICVGELLALTEPQYQMNHSGGGRTRWDYATSPNGPFQSFDPTTYHLNYGSYYVRFAVINGCDSTFSNVVQVDVNDQPVINGQLEALQVCAGQTLDLPEVSVEWMNQNPNDRFAEWQMADTQNGTYVGFNPAIPMQIEQNGRWVRYIAQNSCGEVILGPVRLTVMSADDVWLETITACDAYQLPSGEIITQSQVIEYEEEEPCHHVIHQPIEIYESDYTVEPITSCHEDFVWHGMTFHHSDVIQYAWDTLTNLTGCDSVVELQLEFGSYSTYTHNRTSCGSYEWEMNPGVVYYESQRDSVFVPAIDPEDCDTWYYLELIVGHDTLVEGAPMTECSGFEWHGVTYTSDAILYDSLQTAVTHCDSIVSHQLTILQPYHTEDDVTRCQPMWWYEHYCDQNGDYEHTFTSIEGCDSIVTMHFSLGEYIEREFDTLACESFEWYGNSCSESGITYTHVFQTPQGCDSLVTMHLTLNVTQYFTQFRAACDSIELYGTMYNVPGNYFIYYDTVQSQNGCDSLIYRVNLTVSNSEQMGVIEGSHDVYVASNLVNGVYRYDIDTTGIIGAVAWSVSNPDWQIVETQATYCLVLVSTPGSAVLTAAFRTSTCGEMEKQFEINAGFFGVDEHGIEVKVFPNPTKGTVTIQAEGIESVRLTNMMGQTLDWNEYDRAESVSLNLNHLAPAIYLLEIKTIDGVAKRRVVVCR